MKQYQAIGERLRASSYLPEQKALQDGLAKALYEKNHVIVKLTVNLKLNHIPT